MFFSMETCLNKCLWSNLHEKFFQGENSRFFVFCFTIYELNMSQHAWFINFSLLLTTYGFTPCTKDPIVVQSIIWGIVVLEIYFNDILLTDNEEAIIFVQRHNCWDLKSESSPKLGCKYYTKRKFIKFNIQHIEIQMGDDPIL